MVERIALHQPRCPLLAGVSYLRWWLNVLFLGVTFLGLLALLIVLWAFISWLVLVKVLLIAIYVPLVFRWARNNRPRAFRASDIPPQVLPALRSQ